MPQKGLRCTKRGDREEHRKDIDSKIKNSGNNPSGETKCYTLPEISRTFSRASLRGSPASPTPPRLLSLHPLPVTLLDPIDRGT